VSFFIVLHGGIMQKRSGMNEFIAVSLFCPLFVRYIDEVVIETPSWGLLSSLMES
jgi:hypothetical protein